MLLAGCAAKSPRVGLVRADGPGHTVLIESTGRTHRLVGGHDASLLHALHGYGLEVQGPKLGQRIFVREWRVTDGGDGSQPFVGRLHRHGSHWMVDDRHTQAQFILDPTSLEAGAGLGLMAHEGATVLVVGFITGPHRIHVVHWAALISP
jgi:hypothetical protein